MNLYLALIVLTYPNGAIQPHAAVRVAENERDVKEALFTRYDSEFPGCSIEITISRIDTEALNRAGYYKK